MRILQPDLHIFDLLVREHIELFAHLRYIVAYENLELRGLFVMREFMELFRRGLHHHVRLNLRVLNTEHLANFLFMLVFYQVLFNLAMDVGFETFVREAFAGQLQRHTDLLNQARMVSALEERQEYLEQVDLLQNLIILFYVAQELTDV